MPEEDPKLTEVEEFEQVAKVVPSKVAKEVYTRKLLSRDRADVVEQAAETMLAKVVLTKGARRARVKVVLTKVHTRDKEDPSLTEAEELVTVPVAQVAPTRVAKETRAKVAKVAMLARVVLSKGTKKARAKVVPTKGAKEAQTNVVEQPSEDLVLHKSNVEGKQQKTAVVEVPAEALRDFAVLKAEGCGGPAAVPPPSRLQGPSSGGWRTRPGRPHHLSTYLQHSTELTPDLHVTIAKSGQPAVGRAKLAVTYRGTGRRGRTRWTSDKWRTCRSEARSASDSVMGG